MTRRDATGRILEAKRQRGLTFAAIAQALGRHPLWVAAALFGQATMSQQEAEKVGEVLGLAPEVVAALQEIPSRGGLEQAVPVDPLLYRFYEILQVYGPAFKAVIHELFGDGIMSAIDFELDVRRQPDPNGDRVVVTLNGKFLPYKKW
jgi:cyanate lyase